MHIGWIRVSDEAQAGADRYGKPRQRASIVAEASVRGVPTDGQNWRWFEVDDVCGAHVMFAPETKEVIELARRGQLEGIWVAEASRLARPDDLEAFQFISALQKARCKVYAPGQTYDLAKRIDAFLLVSVLNAAGLERGQIHDRTVGSKEHARSAGKYLGGRYLAFGMLYNKKSGWSYDMEGNAPKVLQAFERVYGGELSLPKLAKQLKLSLYGLRYILHNPIYTGFIESRWEVPNDWMQSGKYGKNNPGAPRCRQVRRETPIRVPAFGLENTTPLVSPELFNVVQRILALRCESFRRESERGWAIYNGFVFCDHCGALMSPEVNKRKNLRYYRCRNGRRGNGCNEVGIRAEVLEKNIDNLLMNQLSDRSFIVRLAMSIKNSDRSSRYRERAAQIESDLRGIDKKRFGYEEMRANQEISRPRLAEHLTKLGAQQAELEKELSKCQESILPTFNEEQLVQMFEQFKGWDTCTRDERRSILAVTIPRLRINSGEVVEIYQLLDNKTVQIAVSNRVMQGRSKNSLSKRSIFKPSQAAKIPFVKSGMPNVQMTLAVPHPFPGVWIKIPSAA